LSKPIPLVEIITGAFHAANCENPDACSNDCGGRMTVPQALAVHKAVREEFRSRIDLIILGAA